MLMGIRVTGQEGTDGVDVVRFDGVSVCTRQLDVTLRAFALREIEWLIGLSIDHRPQARIAGFNGLNIYQTIGIGKNAFSEMLAAAYIQAVALIKMAKIQE